MSDLKTTTNNVSDSETTNTEKKKGPLWPIILITTISVISSAILLTISGVNAKTSCEDTFSRVYEETRQDTYDQYKQQAFDYFEKQNHVSNRAVLTVGSIKEENSLEVLSVSDCWIKISDPDDDADRTTRWVEFNASGVYTVDMSASEFIIDDYNDFILVKLKTPQLNHIALGTDTKVYLYTYEKGFLKWNGDYDSGVKMMLNDRAEALDKLTELLESNDANLAKAKASAESLIRTFIKNVNPGVDLKDSDIQIQFI